jgi:hypothetical protein
LLWILSDALAGRATPIYDDTAQQYMVGCTHGEQRSWLITIKNVDVQTREEGEVTVVSGTNNADPSHHQTFILRGRYEGIEVGRPLKIIKRAGLVAPLVETLISAREVK